MQQENGIAGLFLIAALVMLPGLGNAQKVKKDAGQEEPAKEADVLKFNNSIEAFTAYTASNATVTAKRPLWNICKMKPSRRMTPMSRLP